MTKTVYIVKIEDYDSIIDEVVFDNRESAQELLDRLNNKGLDYYIGLYEKNLYNNDHLEYIEHVGCITIDLVKRKYYVWYHIYPILKIADSYEKLYLKTDRIDYIYYSNISKEHAEEELRKIIAQDGINLEEFNCD